MIDNRYDYQQKAELLKALAHPIRLCIAKQLTDNGGCNVSEMETSLQISQSGVSQHLIKLKNGGIVKSTRKGNEVFYEIANNSIKEVINTFFEKL